MIRYWLVGCGLLAAVFMALPVENTTELKNYGVKDRSVGATLTSEIANVVLEDEGYNRVAPLVPYVVECSAAFEIPANVLLAILYEEAVHRKPLDVQTFGVAQLGVGELAIQGLPPDAKFLEDDRFSVWILARKLKRLQLQTGSLQTAITLHNGYSDYLKTIQKRSQDPRLLQLFTTRRLQRVFTA